MGLGKWYGVIKLEQLNIAIDIVHNIRLYVICDHNI